MLSIDLLSREDINTPRLHIFDVMGGGGGGGGAGGGRETSRCIIKSVKELYITTLGVWRESIGSWHKYKIPVVGAEVAPDGRPSFVYVSRI